MEIFVYGTLTEPARTRQVLDWFEYTGVASLDGLHSVEGRYPTLAPGGSVKGRLLRVHPTDIDAVDAYEGVDHGLYVRESIPHTDRPVEVYIGDPDRLDAPAEWPGSGSFSERVERYLTVRDVRLQRES